MTGTALVMPTGPPPPRRAGCADAGSGDRGPVSGRCQLCRTEWVSAKPVISWKKELVPREERWGVTGRAGSEPAWPAPRAVRWTVTAREAEGPRNF